MVRSRSKRQSNFGRRLARWAAWTATAAILLTALPVLAIRWWDPFSSAFMLQARLEGVAIHYRWVDFERIAPHAGLAAVAAEDQRFPLHHGFDLDSILKAVQDSENGKALRGASTISQQVAKNLFLWSGRSVLRKGLEAWFTVLIETLWPKQRILEVYLNIAEYGRGVYGVEAAANRYLGKTAARLNAAEAALLAAVLPSPRRMHVARPSSYVIGRQTWILAQMNGLGGTSYLGSLQPSASRANP